MADDRFSARFLRNPHCCSYFAEPFCDARRRLCSRFRICRSAACRFCPSCRNCCSYLSDEERTVYCTGGPRICGECEPTFLRQFQTWLKNVWDRCPREKCGEAA